MAFTLNVYTAGNVLSAASLNADNAAAYAVLNAGLTGANIAPDGVSSGTFIADDVIGESHMNWADTTDGVKGMQIGKEANTYQRVHAIGTSAVASVTNAAVVTVTVTYNNDVIMTAGGVVFAATPHVIPYVLTSDTAIGAFVVAAGTANATINVCKSDTYLTTAQVLYWKVVGNV